MKKLVGCLVVMVSLAVLGFIGFALLAMFVSVKISVPNQPTQTPPTEQAKTPEKPIEKEPLAAPSPPPTPTKSEPPKKRTYKIGDTVSIGDFTYNAYRYAWSNSISDNPILDKQPDATWLILEIAVRNDGQSSANVPSFELRDKSGNKYETSPFSFRLKDNIGPMNSLNPGVTKQGFILFDLHMGPHYELVVSSGGFGGFLAETETIDLGIMNPSVEFAQMREAAKQAEAEKAKQTAEARRAKAAEKAASMPMREWASKDGKFRTKAKYVSKGGPKVTLEKEDGKQVTIDLDKLSDADNEYVKSLLN
jgi:hypothetical protein